MNSLELHGSDRINPYDSPAECDVELMPRCESSHADYLRLRRAMIGFMLTLIATIVGIGAPMVARSDSPYVEAALLALYCLCPAIGVFALWKNRTAADAKLTAAKFRKVVIVGRQICIGMGLCSILVGVLLLRFLPEQLQDGSSQVLICCGAAFIICWFLCPGVPRISDYVVDLGGR